MSTTNRWGLGTVSLFAFLLFAGTATLSAQTLSAPGEPEAAAETGPEATKILTEAAEASVQQSVARIFSTIRYPQLYKPWAKSAASESTGTGFFVTGPDGRRLVLTNNHVVGWASQVYVQGYASGERHRAKLIAAAPDMDLALLELREAGALADRAPLRFIQGLPGSGESVSVYGYPTGGNELSVTRGIISRVEVAGYDESTVGLRLQVDAAINPGNSGGPALVDGRVVGVAFQANSDAENIGYLIPANEVLRFFEDVATAATTANPGSIWASRRWKTPRSAAISSSRPRRPASS